MRQHFTTSRLPPAAAAAKPTRARRVNAATAFAAALVLTASLAAAVASAASANEYIEDTDRFPGWKGELPQQQPLADDPATIGFGESGKVSDANRHAACMSQT